MTDRELLELAAKAAGIDAHWGDGWQSDMMFRALPRPNSPLVTNVEWNPLDDDGDALRLFCTLPWLCIETSDLIVTVRERGNPDEPSRVYLMWTEWLDKYNGDPLAATRRATRRAITRAAAETGRTTP